jgi:hypothetical protein
VPQLSPAARRRLWFWELQLGGWSVAALLSAVLAERLGLPFKDAITLAFARAALAVALSGFLLRPLLRYTMARSGRSAALWVALVACVAICWFDLYASFGLGVLLAPSFAPEALFLILKTTLPVRFAVYFIWCGFYLLLRQLMHAQEAELRLAQFEVEAARTELALLRAQVEPHFIFNVLNSILAAADHPESVRAMTFALAEHLRASAKQGGEAHNLAAELQSVENYLRIEKFRFEANLQTRIDAPAEMMDLCVPLGCVLIPVENALRKGYRTSPMPLTIEVLVQRSGDAMVIHVRNSGTWSEGASEGEPAAPMLNLARALEHFGGPAARPEILRKQDSMEVVIRLPLLAVSS